MVTRAKTLKDINQQAIHLMYKELGVVDSIRFLKQFTRGYGNYTKEREEIIGQKSLDEILEEIDKLRRASR